MRGRLPSEPARCCALLSPERMKQRKGAPEDPILFPLSSRTSLLLLSWIQLPGSGGGAAQRRGITQGGKEKRVFLILFYYFARQSADAAAKKAEIPQSPPHLSRSRVARALLRPLLSFFLCSISICAGNGRFMRRK